MEVVASTLRKTKVFRQLNKSDFDALLKYAQSHDLTTLGPGSVICANTRTDENFPFLILEGQVEVKVPGGNSSVLAILQAGDISGFLSLYRPRLNSRSSLCIAASPKSPVRLLRLSRKRFQELIEANPGIALALLRTVNKLDYNSNCLHAGDSDLQDAKSEPREATKYQVFRVVVFDAKKYDEVSLQKTVDDISKAKGPLPVQVHFRFVEPRLSPETVALAAGADAVCLFVNDTLCSKTAYLLRQMGIGLALLRCTGFDRVDLAAADAVGLSVCRVTAYSPYAVAEHAVALLQALNRRIHQSQERTRVGNFQLHGLVGMDLNGKTVGILGTGKIGQKMILIMRGFGCKVLCYDVYENAMVKAMEGVKYVTKEELFKQSDIVSLHMPLFPSTKHIINADAIKLMKPGVLLVNVSRGGLVDTVALLAGLKSGHIAAAGLDVYEGEAGFFFNNWEGRVFGDDVLSMLVGHPRVYLTSHQAFLTDEALRDIATTTLDNILEYSEGKRMKGLTNSLNKVLPNGTTAKL